MVAFALDYTLLDVFPNYFEIITLLFYDFSFQLTFITDNVYHDTHSI